MTIEIFKTTNQDGTPKTCKFCHKPVWWHSIENRWYDVGGESLHVDNCRLRREHFHAQATDRAEETRKGR